MKIPDSPRGAFGAAPEAGAAAPIVLGYIHSASHSGSTLLAQRLAEHPEVATAGELSGTPARAQPGYRCSCGAALAACAFWREVAAAMARRGFAYSATTDETDIARAPGAWARALLRPLHRGPLLEAARDAALALSPSARAHLARQQRLKAALAESVLECAGKAILVDSSKSGLQLKYHLRNPRFDVRMIWLTRDGRGVARSLMRNQGLTMREAAYEWRRSIEEAAAIAARLERWRWRRVRYEDLCAAPQATLEALWRFLGARPAPPREEAQHVLGHASRLAGSREIRLDEKWRDELTRAELDAFEAVAGAANRRLGYSG